MIENPWWNIAADDADLAQGELVYRCLVPIVPNDFSASAEGGSVELEFRETDLIVVTQSCDLVAKQTKTDMVAACPFRVVDPNERWDRLEEMRKGRQEGLHLLASPSDHKDLKLALM